MGLAFVKMDFMRFFAIFKFVVYHVKRKNDVI